MVWFEAAVRCIARETSSDHLSKLWDIIRNQAGPNDLLGAEDRFRQYSHHTRSITFQTRGLSEASQSSTPLDRCSQDELDELGWISLFNRLEVIMLMNKHERGDNYVTRIFLTLIKKFNVEYVRITVIEDYLESDGINRVSKDILLCCGGVKRLQYRYIRGWSFLPEASVVYKVAEDLSNECVDLVSISLGPEWYNALNLQVLSKLPKLQEILVDSYPGPEWIYDYEMQKRNESNAVLPDPPNLSKLQSLDLPVDVEYFKYFVERCQEFENLKSLRVWVNGRLTTDLFETLLRDIRTKSRHLKHLTIKRAKIPDDDPDQTLTLEVFKHLKKFPDLESFNVNDEHIQSISITDSELVDLLVECRNLTSGYLNASPLIYKCSTTLTPAFLSRIAKEKPGMKYIGLFLNYKNPPEKLDISNCEDARFNNLETLDFGTSTPTIIIFPTHVNTRSDCHRTKQRCIFLTNGEER